MSRANKKKIFVIGIQVVIALLFIIGPDFSNPSFRILYHSYFADIFLPFGFYFLITITENKMAIVKNWWGKALLVFSLCAISEILQYYGYYALAVVFDPVDFIMYASGVLLAAFLDRAVFIRLLPFWE